MDGLANAVFDNLVFLQICVPLVGSLLVVVVSGGGLPVVRRTACSNTFISLVLTGLMVAHYDPPDETGVASGTTQMVSILPWVSPQFPKSIPTTDDDSSIDVDRVSASGVRFSVGVDGLSLIFIAIASLTSFAAVWTSPSVRLEQPAVFYGLLLLAQSSICGVFAALDVILFCFFLQMSIVPMFFLIGLWGKQDRSKAGLQYAVVRFAGSVLIFVGLISLSLLFAWMKSAEDSSVGNLTYSIPVITAEIPRLVADDALASYYWSQFGPWVFLPLLGGIAVFVPLFPFHFWLKSVNDQALPVVSAIVSGVGLTVGSYGFLRFLIPIFPEMCAVLIDPISDWACLSILAGAVLAFTARKPQETIFWVCWSHSALCVLAMASLHRFGIGGAVLLVIQHALAYTGIMLLMATTEFHFQATSIRAPHHTMQGHRFAIVLLLFALLVFGIPTSLGFVAKMTSLFGIYLSNPQLTAAGPSRLLIVLLAELLIVWSVLRTLPRFARTTRESRTRSHPNPVNSEKEQLAVARPENASRDLSWRELVSFSVLAAVLFAMGLFPQSVFRYIDPTLDQVLRSPRDDDKYATIKIRRKDENRFKNAHVMTVAK